MDPADHAVDAGHGGTVLHVEVVDRSHPGAWLGGGRAGSVRPALVAAAVRRALSDGWDPARPGSAFRLDQTSTVLDDG